MSILSASQIRNLSGNPIVNSTGSILQVVQLTYSGQSSNSSISSFTNTPFGTLSITPSSSTSKILLSANFSYLCTATTTVAFRFTRNGTPIGGSGDTYNASFGAGGSANTAWRTTVNWQYLDSPSSTSALSYVLQFLPYDSGRIVFWNSTSTGTQVDNFAGVATFLAMEVSG